MTHEDLPFGAPPPPFIAVPAARQVLNERLGETYLAVARLRPGLPAVLRDALEAWMNRLQDQVAGLDDDEAVLAAGYLDGSLETHLATALQQATGRRRAPRRPRRPASG